MLVLLEHTDWSVFEEGCFNTYVDAIVGYINFCVETTVLAHIFRLYSNNKPWLSGEAIELIRERREAMRNCCGVEQTDQES